ncbi:PREDICTED: zinc finger CCCH domain-containing protein 5 [Tarenaya hassleriana]|uniref:zinc finger CCCH domain-containing protein 5 n=1 Tax=Tarenaya hassleriana TaxID=28532 RepID=UPI00053C7814|nr:PREDICTED: zinc finger CCCH domain-containing protein 5 [Tarenaya hassleriana]
MEQPNGTGGEGERGGESAAKSRREKRKAMKKMRRKQVRKEMAEKEREDAEAKERLCDPVEQERLRAADEEEARRRERELKEFEERERAWLEAMELKKKKEEAEEEAEREEEARRKKELEGSRKLENECDEDDEWEHVEEGPPEIIFQGDEIILRKKKVRVPKKSHKLVEAHEIADRPTSNPLPPETEAFTDLQKASSAQQVLENVAHQLPNFGTEQDKAHCPFHLKTGACRFGQRCSRVHFYPDKSCTLLMKNMYTGPGIAWEQDEGLEYSEDEVERCYEEFYEDVHTEFLKYGELVNFKVCRNGSFHLRGNVYVHYRSLESAILAYQSINGRYFAGKQVQCEFVNISRWKVAICGEYMKSRLKTCSRGSSCNFIHCFRNPGGDYEWADYDKPPPRYWIRKMVALFGYSDEYMKQRECESSSTLKDSGSDSHRRPARRSRSRDGGYVSVRERCGDTSEGSHGHRAGRVEDHGHDERGTLSSDTKEGSSGREYARRTLYRESKWSDCTPGYWVTRERIREQHSDDDSSDGDGDTKRFYKRKRSNHYGRPAFEVRGEQLDDEKEQKSSRKRNREGSSSTDNQVNTIQDRSKHRHERNSSRSSPGDWLEEDFVEKRHHHHKRKGSYPQDDVSDRSNVQNLGSTRDRRNSRQRKRDSGLKYGTRDDETHPSEEKSEEETWEGRHHRHRRRDSRPKHEILPSANNYPKERNSETNPCKSSSASLVCETKDYVDGIERWKPHCSGDEST